MAIFVSHPCCCGLVPWQLCGYGRSDRSTKLIRGLTSEAPAGFQSRRGLSYDDSAPVSPHSAPFPTYKAPQVHHASRGCGCRLAAGGARAATGNAGDTAVRAAPAATKTIPIVCVTGADPVALGFVSSLNRPGGNITGVASLADEVGPKRLEVVRELLPTTSVIALLINPTNPTAETISKDVQASARVLGQVVHILNASTEREIDTAFERIAELRAGALLVTIYAFYNNRPGKFIAFAARLALPAIYPWREFVLAGGLMIYGTSIAYLYRELGFYVGRVPKGDKPADLPVQQSTKAELVINLKTANALGLTFPITLLGRADEVIE